MVVCGKNIFPNIDITVNLHSLSKAPPPPKKKGGGDRKEKLIFSKSYQPTSNQIPYSDP